MVGWTTMYDDARAIRFFFMSNLFHSASITHTRHAVPKVGITSKLDDYHTATKLLTAAWGGDYQEIDYEFSGSHLGDRRQERILS